MPHEQKTTITIAQDGTLYLAGERLDVSQLTLRLKALGRTQPVVIRADPTSDAQRVIGVMEACKAASVSRISALVAAR
jgi:biopolymer transport protein ExbD